MDRDTVIRENLVDRYLLGQLDESEAMAFEDFYAGSPETLAELEESALLIDGIREVGGADRRGARVSKIGGGRRRQGALKRVLGSPRYGVAASLVAAAALAALVLRPMPAGIGGARTAAINVPIVALSPLRGGSGGLEVAVGDARYVAMALDLGIPESGNYRVSLLDPDGDLLWQADGLRPDDGQSLTFMLPTDVLADGNLRLVARPADGPGATLSFPFFTSR